MKFESQLQIVTAAGVAPFTVNQAQLVINLNADLLDGQHGSYYQNADNLNAGTVPSARLSGTYSIDITGYSAAVVVSDSRSVTTTPQTINRGVVFDFKENATDGLADGGTYFGEMTFRQYGNSTDWSGGKSHQLGFTDNGNIWQRSGSSTTWGAWKKLLDSTNYSSYALSINGGSVSGTLWIYTTSTSTGATPVFPFGISRQTSRSDALLLGVDGNADAVIAANDSALRLGKVVSGVFTEGAKLDTSGNLSVVGTLTEGGYLAFPERVYALNLTAQSSSSFYPIVINGAPGGDVWHHRFSLEMPSQSGTAPYNMDHLYGDVRGGGWTDQTGFYRVLHDCYEDAERSLLGIYKGDQSFYGVVVYVRGGQTYYVRTTSRSVTAYTAATTLGGSTFAIKNAAGADVSGTSAAISQLLNLIGNPQGFYSSYNGYVGTDKVLTAANYNSYALPLTGGTLTGGLTVNNNAGLRAYYGSDAADYLGYGVEFGRSTSYLRPTTNRLANLWVGGTSINGNDWANIDFYSSGRFNINNNAILHAGNYNSYAMLTTGLASGSNEYVNFRVIRNFNAYGPDGMYIGYGNSSSGRTRIYGEGSTSSHVYPDGGGNLYKSDGAAYIHSSNYTSYAVDNTRRVKQFFWDQLAASATQARRFEIARIAIDIINWNGSGNFEIEVSEAYWGRGLVKKYVVSYGFGTPRAVLKLVQMSGAGENNFQVAIGSEQQMSGNQYYLPIYVDVREYTNVNVRVTTSRVITSNSTPAVGYTYINPSPSPTNISDFTADSTVDLSNAASAWQVGGNTLLHSGNLSTYSLLRGMGFGGTSPNWDTLGDSENTIVAIYQSAFNTGATGASNYPTSASYQYGALINFGTNLNARAQVYISHAGNDLIFRGGWGTDSWQNWNKCLTDRNYSNYAAGLLPPNVFSGTNTFNGAVSIAGGLEIVTSGSVTSTSTMVVRRSGQAQVFFGYYSGDWRSAIQIQSNANNRLLFFAPPDDTYQYGIIRSANGGLKIDIGGTTSNGGTNAVTIETTGVANFPVGLQQGGNQVLHAGNYSSYSPPLAQAVYGENSTATTGLSENSLDTALKSGFYTVTKVDNSKLPASSTSVNFLIHCAYSGVGNLAGIDLLTQNDTASNLFYRNATGAGKGAWRTIIDSSNYNSYVLAASGTAASLSIGGNAATATTSTRLSDATGSLRLSNPGGASYATLTSSIAGAIKIKLPTASFKSNTMLRFTVRIYEYSGGGSGTSRTIEIGGYNYSDTAANWYNVFATQSTMGGGDINVRFGNDGTSQCVWIGEVGGAWVYPQVTVTDFQAGYSNYTDAMWSTGWAISFATSFDTVTQGPIIAAKPLTSQNYSGYALPLSGGTLSGNLTINGNITSGAGYQLRWSDGSASAPGYSFYADTDTGIHRSADNTLALVTAGVVRVTTDPSGNVGVGVTPSAWASTYRALQIGGYSSLVGITNDTQTHLSTNARFDGTNWLYIGTSPASRYSQVDNIHKWFNAISGSAGLTITFIQAMTLDASSNLSVVGSVTAASFSGAGTGLTGTAASLTAGAATNATQINGLSLAQVFNNMGQSHSAYADANNIPGFGFYYLQGSTNGPGNGNGQWYGITLGLGNEYAFSSYACQFAIPRPASGGNPYLAVRYREAGTWGSWSKVYAGYSDVTPWSGITSKPTTLSGYGITDALPLSGGTLSGNLTSGAGYQVRWSDGSASTPGYSFYAETGTGMYRSATNTLAFATGGVLRVSIDGSGNLTATGTVTGSSFSGAGTGLTGAANSLSVGGYSARWATGRTISLTGDVTGTSGAFDGTANLSFAASLANGAVTYAKIQNVAAASVLGNTSASVSQAPQAISFTDLNGYLSGAAKAWVTFNENSSTGAITVNASFGISSVTRLSAGVYQVNFSTAFSDAHYAVSGAIGFESNGSYLYAGYLGIPRVTSPKATGSCMVTATYADGLNYNARYVHVVFHR